MVTAGGSASFSKEGTSDGMGPERRANTRFLAKDVHPKAAALRGDIREIEIIPLGEMLSLRAREDLGDVPLEFRHPQLTEFDGQEIAVHAKHRRYADGQVHVRAALLRPQLQERVNTRQSLTSML